ncbi:N-acetylmuramoyl-L-alanine amidase family protein [Bombilactobacillus mellis]|uniref:peptidoglycan recognition protein family protein n=1 Tax=Bombilactobacillus mellis TaxID=1218508 RepID=UPI00158027E2|nr:peptidoglycan recognition family protein [Bombilactobacillus mellis]NUF25402.1 N-acetylmuramoyl-L-alanine amidase [Bombilactobacillus mellis]
MILSNKMKLAIANVVAWAALLVVFVCPQSAQAQTINEYIQQNNIQPKQIQRVNGTFNRFFGYNNGVGRPEGVVIHETATPGATAWNEVTYFNREWPNIQSYVHAFVDANNILQIHNTDYGVWGAGPWANSRMVQIELCQENTWDAFARSVNNQAYFTAVMLKKYGLTPSLADGKGYGTIWSHYAINQYHPSAGGHVDPITYFNKWGYTMWQFYQLVQYHYNQLNGGGNNDANNPYGVITISSNPVAAIYARNDDGSSMHQVIGRFLPINSAWRTAQTFTYEGQTLYQVSTNEWVKAADCVVTKPIPNK